MFVYYGSVNKLFQLETLLGTGTTFFRVLNFFQPVALDKFIRNKFGSCVFANEAFSQSDASLDLAALQNLAGHDLGQGFFQCKLLPPERLVALRLRRKSSYHQLKVKQPSRTTFMYKEPTVKHLRDWYGCYFTDTYLDNCPKLHRFSGKN